MREMTWHTMTERKAEWGEGPWTDEPDKWQWVDGATGYPCLIKRNHFGVLCGYVGVGKDHPLAGKSYTELDVEVHGGLSFSGYCEEGDDAHTICHVPEPGEEEPLYWFGFDCGHGWDYQPGMQEVTEFIDEKLKEKGEEPFAHALPMYNPTYYKDVDYVAEECRRLAEQLKEAE